MRKELTDEQIQARLDDAILKANPEKLTDEELDRRLQLRGHKSPDMVEGMADAAGDILGMAGTIVDYPMGVARAGIDAVSNIFMGERTPSEGAQQVVDALKGPSNAPTSQQIAEKVGIPSTPIPGTDYPQSALAGLGLDVAMGIPATAAANLLTKGASKLARGVLSADEMALKAIGERSKTALKDIKFSDKSSPTENLQAVSKYAQKEIVGPLSSTQKMLEIAGQKMQSIGQKLGEMRRNNEKQLDDWFVKNASKPEAKQYVEGMFLPNRSRQRIFEAIDQDIADPHYADQVKKIISDKMEALASKYYNTDIPVEEISRLKAGWQREVDFGKELSDYSVRQDAFNYLQREANRAIDNNFSFGDKVLKGSDLAAHKKLKEEYGMLTRMTDNLQRKLAKETSSNEPVLKQINPLNSSRIQSTIASIPENPKPFGAKSQAVGAAGQMMNMRQGEYKEPMIESFPVSMTDSVYNVAMTMGLPPEIAEATLRSEIQKNNNLSNIQKANRLQLLNKHGRVYLGQ